MRKCDWRVIGPVMLGVALVLGLLPFLKGGLYILKHEGDTVQFADIVLRQAAGQWPHLDFMTPIGVLAAEPIAAFVRLGLPFGAAFFWAQLLMALVLLVPAMIVISRRAPADWSGPLYGAIIMIFCLALVHGETQNATSISMHYNRWSWAISYILLPLVLLEPRGGERPASEGILLGLGLAALVLIKMTYFLALAPALVIGLLARGWWRTLVVGMVAGLAVAALVTVMAGPGYWRAYAGDLMAVASSTARPAPGGSYGMVAAAPINIGATVVLIATIILLRLTGRKTEGMVLLFLAPGLNYIVYQNFGNDPQWLMALAFLAWALRPDAPVLNSKGRDLAKGVGLVAVLAAAFGFPSMINLAYSPIRHLFEPTEKTAHLLGLPGQNDLWAAESRLYGVSEQRYADGPGTPFATYRAYDGREGRSFINGEELPYCEIQSGIRANFEMMAADLKALGYGGKKLLNLDLFTPFHLYSDLPSVPGAAPWNYGTLAGVDQADYLVVPLCPFGPRIRSGILEALDKAGYALTVKERRPLYYLVAALKSAR